MHPGDLPAVEAIAERVHPDHPERPEVFAERLALAPEGCLVLAGEGGLAGYAVSHPWQVLLGPPPLDALLGALPGVPDAWHVHDIALLPEARGAGLASALLDALLAAAARRGFGRATLVAVPGKAAFWERRGFRAMPPAPGAAAALASYGAGAAWMARALGDWPFADGGKR